MKLWGGRFNKDTAAQLEEFAASIGFDWRLYQQDIEGSIAHAKMLAKQGIISEIESEKIIAGLREIEKEIKTGNNEFTASQEDIHMYIESRLREKIGPIAGKLHTARSRNDQVALDTHLFVKAETEAVMQYIQTLQETILQLAENNLDVIMPGYTHLQLAQPVLFSHHLMAYFEMLERDWQRYKESLSRSALSPLGAGALAGTSFPIDPRFISDELQLQGIYGNSMDAVADRDYIIEFLGISALLMLHLSRLCEELVIWSTKEFDFIELDDAYTTGSSIMPQKKNPDIPELIRGKAGRVYGNLFTMLTVMKNLPLTYNKDQQEDKEPLFDTVDTVKACLRILPPLLESMIVKKENMYAAAREGFCEATDVADYLAKKGMPFREAHNTVGKIVQYCLQRNLKMEELQLDELVSFSALFSQDIFQVMQLESIVAARESNGGTAPAIVRNAIIKARERIKTKADNQ